MRLSNYDRLLEEQWSEYQKMIPELKLRYKDEHWAWKLAPKGLRQCSTSLGKDIWLPTGHHESNIHEYDPSVSAAEKFRKFKTIAHEFQHALDWKRYGVLDFVFRYLFPQILAIVPLLVTVLLLCLGQWVPAMAAAVLVVLLIVPWPSSTRTAIERRGYMLNFFVEFLRYGTVTEASADFVLDAMESPLYYWMFNGDGDDLIIDMIDKVSGPRWPRSREDDFRAFNSTAFVMLETDFVCEIARNRFRQ